MPLITIGMPYQTLIISILSLRKLISLDLKEVTLPSVNLSKQGSLPQVSVLT